MLHRINQKSAAPASRIANGLSGFRINHPNGHLDHLAGRKKFSFFPDQFTFCKNLKDVIGDAFEVFAESKLVGEKGEFFTPREVVKMAVRVVDPKPRQTVCDPACGSGGFLIY